MISTRGGIPRQARPIVGYWFALSLLLFTSVTASAQVPKLIRYQGTLVDANNVPLEGTYALTFRVYDAASVGSVLWSETQSAVPVSRGVFNVLLGQVTSLTLAFDKDYWLTTQVGTDAEMTPRQRLTSVPYAYRAEVANQLSSGTNIGARVSATQTSISDNTYTALSFPNKTFDTDSMWNSGQNDRLTIQTAGKYLIYGMVEWDLSGIGVRSLSIHVNNAVHPVGFERIGAHSGVYHFMCVMAVANLSAGDYVQLKAYQTSGGSLTIYNEDGSPYFTAIKIG